MDPHQYIASLSRRGSLYPIVKHLATSLVFDTGRKIQVALDKKVKSQRGEIGRSKEQKGVGPCLFHQRRHIPGVCSHNFSIIFALPKDSLRGNPCPQPQSPRYSTPPLCPYAQHIPTVHPADGPLSFYRLGHGGQQSEKIVRGSLCKRKTEHSCARAAGPSRHLPWGVGDSSPEQARPLEKHP